MKRSTDARSYAVNTEYKELLRTFNRKGEIQKKKGRKKNNKMIFQIYPGLGGSS